MIAYRVTTNDFRAPIQGGSPIWDGTTPFRLPVVALDTSEVKCGSGWSARRLPEDALRIAGEWRDGRPSILWDVEAVEGHDPIDRGDKLRAATWIILRRVPEAKAHAARLRLYAPMAGGGLPVEDIVAEVEAWRVALARPTRDAAAVEAGLRAALTARGLDWSLRLFPPSEGGGGAWAAWDARAAMIHFVACRRGWLAGDPALLSVGIRDAYSCGLGMALPVAPGVLGWSMDGGGGDEPRT